MRITKQFRTQFRHYSAFRMHATIFVLMIGALWLLWLLGGSMIFYSWLLLPTFIWAGILAIHWYIVYRELQAKKKR